MTAMPFFDSAGVQIHYEVFGDGRPLVLVHGFASNLRQNWIAPGWVETLRPLRRVIALDCRGHGESGKPQDPAAYGNAMQDDVVRLMDHLEIEQADLFGYSMGGAISMGLLVRYPERFASAVLGGVGGRGPRRGPDSPVARGMLAKDASEIDDPVAKGFRVFAERTGNDLKALAAVNQGNRFSDLDALRSITVPVLIVVGANDTLVGGAEPIARAIQGSRLVTIPDREHLTVVGDQRFKDVVVAFLRER
jgi:pimeloyl-ACP methyl ester carboxylesterase